MIIDPATFKAAAIQPEHKYWVDGTVECTLDKQVRVCRAMKTGTDITAYGFVTKYRTGTKLWPAQVSQRTTPEGKIWESLSGGFDSRSGKHQRLNNVWFNKEVQ